MTGIIPFEAGGKLPAYLQDASFMTAFDAVNDDVSNFQSFPQLSLKGGKWAIVKGDERTVLMKPNVDPPEAAQFVEGVMIRINDKARTYYKGRFNPNETDAEKKKPTCYSHDGITPSDFSLEKQNDKCATCKWSAFGTAVDEQGQARKGSACASNARVAFATTDKIAEPYLLRVPPTSLRPLRDIVDLVRKRNMPYPIIVVRIGFDPNETQPVLTFRPTGVLDELGANAAIAAREDSVVRAICGLDERVPRSSDASPKEAPPAAEPTAANALDDAIAKRFGTGTAPVQAAAPEAPAPAPAPRSTPVETPVANVAASAPAPAPAQAAPVVAEPIIVSKGGADDPLAALNSMLGQLDDPK